MSTLTRALAPLLALGCGMHTTAHALVAIIQPGPTELYLQVGDGAYNTTPAAPDHRSGATPAANPVVNLVSVTVPGAQLGNGRELTMRSDSTVTKSFFDSGRSFSICIPAAGEVYVGGWWRNAAPGAGPAHLSVQAPVSLTSGAHTIPFGDIRWEAAWSPTKTGTSEDVASGRFRSDGGPVILATIPPQQWHENCHVFFYANRAVQPAGVYRGRVTYTLVSP